MKKYTKIIISFVLVFIGLIGVLVCILPSASNEYKIINKYVDAVNDCDMEKIKACLPLDELSGTLGISLDSSLGSASAELISKLDFLKASNLTIGRSLPEDVKSVEKITLISCAKNGNLEAELFSVSTVNVEGVVKVTYITADDEKASITSIEDFSLVKTANGFKLIG